MKVYDTQEKRFIVEFSKIDCVEDKLIVIHPKVDKTKTLIERRREWGVIRNKYFFKYGVPRTKQNIISLQKVRREYLDKIKEAQQFAESMLVSTLIPLEDDEILTDKEVMDLINKDEYKVYCDVFFQLCST